MTAYISNLGDIINKFKNGNVFPEAGYNEVILESLRMNMDKQVHSYEETYKGTPFEGQCKKLYPEYFI